MLAKSKKYNKKGNVLVLFVLIAMCICFAKSATAQGDLLIFPKRVVFDGKKKVEKLILSNIGKDSAVYAISFTQRRMAESGKLEPINEPDSGQKFATPYLRVFPRRVILAPGESQIVKLQVSKTNTIEDGEYRSHLLFIPEKKPGPLGLENNDTDTSDVTVRLEPVFGISIPTIIRKGTSNTICSISDLSYTTEDGNGDFLTFNISRLGNMSVYGDITIFFTSNSNTIYEVGKASGLAVYTPGSIRKVMMQLQKPDGVDFRNGIFKVIYTENEGTKILAETEQRL